MNYRTSIRVGALGLVLLGTLAMGGRMLGTPQPLDRELPAVEFPAEPALAGWQRLPADVAPYPSPKTTRYRKPSADHPIELELQFIPDLAVHYVYNTQLQERFIHHGELPLDAGMRYSVNSRSLIVPNLRGESPRLTSVEIDDAGFGIWTAGARIHLTTFVTPAGDFAISRPRVARSMFLDHLSFGLVWSWLRGRAVLPDRRCVLIHFSIPAEGVSVADARGILSSALLEWREAHVFKFPLAAMAPR